MDIGIMDSLPKTQRQFTEKTGELFIRAYETNYNKTTSSNRGVGSTRTATRLELCLEDTSVFPIIFNDKVGYELFGQQVTFSEEVTITSREENGRKESQIVKKQEIVPVNSRFPSYKVTDVQFESY